MHVEVNIMFTELVDSIVANSRTFTGLAFRLDDGVQIDKHHLGVLAANVDDPLVLVVRAVRKFMEGHRVAGVADLVTPSQRTAWDADELVGEAIRHAGQIQGQQPSDDREVQDGKETVWLIPSLGQAGDIFRKPFPALVIKTTFRMATSWVGDDVHIVTSVGEVATVGH